VGQGVEITFTDDQAWRSAISGITVNGTVLTGEQYTISAGKINLAAGVFTAASDYTIAVTASGYSVATIKQTINRSAAEELATAKSAAKNTLDTYKNPADYRDAQKTELASAINAGKSAIDAATDINAVNSALAAAKAELDKIKTDAQFTAEDKTETIEIGDSHKLTKKDLELIKESGKEITFVRKDKNGRILYSWTLNGSKIDAAMDDIDLSISFTTENKAAIDKLTGDENSVYLSFAYEGKLPAPALITAYVGDKYKDGDKLNLYYFNEKTGKAEEIAAGLTVKDGYVSFTLTHMSDYFLTENKISQIEVTDDKEKEKTQDTATGDRASMAIWSLICGAGIIGAAYLLMRKRRSI
jgi:uncharacterized protein (UPF0264 family)